MVLAVYTIKYGIFWLILIFGAFLTFNVFMTFVPYQVKWSNDLPATYSYYQFTQTENQFIHTSEVLEITKCFNAELNTKIAVEGNHWILQNFVKATERFQCFESITYTTQADFTFLPNLIPLVERWRGPISVAVYAPGDDFERAIRAIAWLRGCETPLIRRYVTFHLFMETQHFPLNLTKVGDIYRT